jgi:protein-disulfide isomerase
VAEWPRIGGAALVAALLLACTASKATPGADSTATQDADLRAARTKGSPTAPVTIYEMSDFQCPWCGRFVHETLPVLEREYVATGKVRLVFVNFPLPMHRNAVPAAEIAMCAAKQNRFWPMHDQLFRTQEQWGELEQPGSFFLALADSAGLDRDQVTACVRTAATRDLVRSDADGSVRSGAHSTPSFYIEGGLMAGAQPIEVFRTVLDSIIRTKTAGR